MSGRVTALDEVKGVAILMIVVLYHAGGVLGLANTLHGETGVDIFVIVSGIGLALGNQDETAGRYLSRRFARIYPAYWAAYTAFLVAAIFVRGMRYSAGDVILHYAGLQTWFGDVHAMSVNDSFWFITLVVSLYAAFVPLRRFIDRPDLLLFSGLSAAVVTGSLFLTLFQPACFGHLACRIPDFFVGLVIGRYMRTGKLDERRRPAVALAMLLLLYLPWAMSYPFTSPWVGCALMASYACVRSLFLPSWVPRVLKYLGDRSLWIFLIHQPLMRDYNILVLKRLLPNAELGSGILVVGMAAAFALTLILSEIFHRGFAPVAGVYRRRLEAAGA